MRIFILGGTVFLGKHLVTAALARGHDVTIFHRGEHPARDLPPGVREILGNRDESFAALADHTWDVVIDTSAFVPRQVRAAVQALADRVGRYILISTISVYAEAFQAGMDESAPVATLADPLTEEVTGETYGALKALCEQALQAAMPAQAMIIRPGLIVGPSDPSDRFTYWPWRVARGGEVLAPDAPNHGTQIIDARDLAEWTVRMAEARQTGIFNATGPDFALTLGEVLATCQRIAASDAQFTWVSEDFLAAHEVEPYTALPLWVPREMAAFDRVNCAQALAAGLTFRPLADTVRDTLVWAQNERGDAPWRAGLSPEREQELLAAWREQSQP
jgi:2'-hydroxyisoflavone reductase